MERRFFFGYPLKFDQTLFSMTPESFYPVDIDFTRSKYFLMIDFNMTISTKHQRIIPSEFIGINDTSSSNGFDGHIQQCFSYYIFNHFYFNNAISLQDSKYKDFISCSSSSFSFTSAIKITLIHFHFTTQKFIHITGVRNNDHSNHRDRFKNCGITQSNLFSDSPGREFQSISQLTNRNNVSPNDRS